MIKLGADGALIVDGDGPARHVPSIAVDPVDTTAAGDAFTAAMTVALAEGRPLDEAVRFGCVTGALATTTLGAQPAMPTRDHVERTLENHS